MILFILYINIYYEIRAVGDAILFPVASVGGRSSLPDAVIGSISFGRFAQQGCDRRRASAASTRSYDYVVRYNMSWT